MTTEIEKIQSRIIVGIILLIISSIILGVIVQPALDDMQEERDEKYGKVVYPDYEPGGWFTDPVYGTPKELWPQWKEEDYQRLVAIRIVNIIFIIAGIVIVAINVMVYLFATQSKPSQQQPSVSYCPRCGTLIPMYTNFCGSCGSPRNGHDRKG